MSKPIMNLLKASPIVIKENLLTICRETGIDVDPKETRAVIQAKSDEFAQLSDTNEQKVRDHITEIRESHEERLSSISKKSQTPNTPHPSTHTENKGAEDNFDLPATTFTPPPTFDDMTSDNHWRPPTEPLVPQSQRSFPQPLLETENTGTGENTLKRSHEKDNDDDEENVRKRARAGDPSQMTDREILEYLFKERQEEKEEIEI